jgi:diaminohydroxyphosphoribosylaminopyrimidine deaminase/5-amino-6-(5-phosphoribosylamino)uracil reductase
VLIEGGAATAGRFVDARLVNKVTFFVAPKIVAGVAAPSAIGGTGIEKMAEALELERVEVGQRGKDLEISGYPRYTKG